MGDQHLIAACCNQALEIDIERPTLWPRRCLCEMKPAIFPDVIGIGYTQRIDAFEFRRIRFAISIVVNDALVLLEVLVAIRKANAKRVRLIGKALLSFKAG